MQILHVVGFGRSGSTLLNRLLGQDDRIIDLGEIRFFYERGVINNERCSCGEKFSDCKFWKSVAEDYFLAVDKTPEHLKNLNYDAQRNRNLMATYKRDMSRFSEFFTTEKALIDAIEKHCVDKKLIVDTSKIPVRSHLYASSPELADKVKVLHLVRDPRAVSFSWTKKVKRPETDNIEEMARFSVIKSTLLWIGVNMISYLLRFRYGASYKLMTYEALCQNPKAMLDELYEFLALDAPLETGEQHKESHALSGNPMRFAPMKAIKVDDGWRAGLTFPQKLISTILAYPYYRLLGGLK